jgi:hypothetical protein
MTKRVVSPLRAVKEVTGAKDRSIAIQRLVASIRTLAKDRGYRVGVTESPYEPRVYARMLGAVDIAEDADMLVAGAIVFHGTDPVIHLNPKSGSRVQQRFTLAHEVAHLAIWYTQKQIDPSYRPRRARGKRTDQLCHEIAAELLVPQDELRQEWQDLSAKVGIRGRKLQIIEQVARQYDVSLQMAAVRFREICAPSTGIGMLQGETCRFLWSIGIRSHAELATKFVNGLATARESESAAESYGFLTYCLNREGLHIIPFSWHRLHGSHYLVVEEG